MTIELDTSAWPLSFKEQLRKATEEIRAERDAVLEDRERLQGKLYDKDFELIGLHQALRKETEDRERLRTALGRIADITPETGPSRLKAGEIARAVLEGRDD